MQQQQQQQQHALEILSDSARERTYHFCILGVARFRGGEERLERDEAGAEGEDGTPTRLEDVEADKTGLGRDVCARGHHGGGGRWAEDRPRVSQIGHDPA